MGSMVFNTEVNKLDNEFDREAFEQAYDAMKALMNVTSGSNRHAIVRGLWTAFGTEHRTNQQSFVRSIFEMFRIFGGCERNRACDARNESSYNFAVDISKRDDIFPYI